MAKFLPVVSLNIEQNLTKVTYHCESFAWHWPATDKVSHGLIKDLTSVGINI